MTLKIAAKVKGKLTCSLKNDIRNFVNFHAISQRSENLHFDWIHLTKAYKDLDEKLQKSYVSWHWRVMQSLKKSWLLAPKITWGIWWTLMQAVASLKICTLMCYFCQYHITLQLKRNSRTIAHDTEEWSKLRRKIDFCLKNDMRKVESLKICTLMGYFCRKYVMFELKRYRGVVLWKMTYGFKNDISNLVNFHTSSWK